MNFKIKRIRYNYYFLGVIDINIVFALNVRLIAF